MDLVSGTSTNFSTATGRSNRKSGNLSIGAILSICICVFVLSKIFLGTLCYRKWVKQHSTCEIKLSGKLLEVLLHTSKSAICSLLCPGIDQEEIHVEQTRATSVQESEAWGSSERASGSIRILLEPSSCCGSAYDFFCKILLFDQERLRACRWEDGDVPTIRKSNTIIKGCAQTNREAEAIRRDWKWRIWNCVQTGTRWHDCICCEEIDKSGRSRMRARIRKRACNFGRH